MENILKLKNIIVASIKGLNLQRYTDRVVKSNVTSRFMALILRCKKFWLPLYFFFVFFYLEFLLKILAGYKIFTLGIFSNYIYLIFMSIICYTICKISAARYNKILALFITVCHCIYFAIQFGSYKILTTYFTLSASDSVGGILQFKNELINIITTYFFAFLLFFLPIFVFYKIRKHLNFRPFNKIRIQAHLIFSAIILVIYMVTLSPFGTYSARSLTFNYNDMGLSVSKLGLSNAGHMDLIKNMTNFKEKITHTSSTSESVVEVKEDIIYGLNTMNLDLTTEYNSISEYFDNETGSYQNEYTGLFKDKNVILILAESYTDIALSKELTPTLYKLVHEGFNFTNFYSPTIFSTIGGEFQMLTGLYPGNDAIKKFKEGSNTYTYSIANTFIENGYKTNAYHNNEYTFQGRSLYIPALGFENFMACGNGLEEYINSTWLQSDTEMMDATVDFYGDEERFFTFYATVSGHGSYDNSNKYAVNNMETVEAYLSENGLNYSTAIKYYLGAQMELDNAIAALITQLETRGILEDTVIVMAGDHYPYLLSNEQINEASSYNKDDAIDINKSDLFVWNSEMEPITIDKVGSQIDIVPTILNLMGFDYDSRIIVGKDILSDTEGLAMFIDRSWISDKGRYYHSQGKFIPNEGVEVADDYVSTMNKIVATKISISSELILQDYYKDLKLMP